MKPLDMGMASRRPRLFAYLGGSVTGVHNVTSDRDFCGLIEIIGSSPQSWCYCGSGYGIR